MSEHTGPDRRESYRSGRRVTSMGLDDEFGMDIPEDYTYTVHAGKRHYHVWGEVLASFSAGDGTEVVIHPITGDVESDFKAECIISGAFDYGAFSADFDRETF